MASRWSSVSKLLPRKPSRNALYFLLGAAGAAALALQAPPDSAPRLAVDGAVRSSRALYTVNTQFANYSGNWVLRCCSFDGLCTCLVPALLRRSLWLWLITSARCATSMRVPGDTVRSCQSKSALGTRLSVEEKRSLKQELKSLKMGDISTFIESPPPDFFAILRTDGLLRSIISKLGAPRHVRLLAYAKHASLGLAAETRKESGHAFEHALSRTRANMGYLYLRMLLEILELLTKLEEFGHSIVREVKWMLLQVLPFFNRSFFLSKT